MKKLVVILVLMTLTLCSCKTKYIETVHYEPVEVHDTVNVAMHVRDSITLHDSVFIHMKGDTVFSERWRTEYRWKKQTDTVVKIREVPKLLTDTISQIKEVPVEKPVYRQHWWQKLLTGIGGLTSAGLIISIFLYRKRII